MKRWWRQLLVALARPDAVEVNRLRRQLRDAQEEATRQRLAAETFQEQLAARDAGSRARDRRVDELRAENADLRLEAATLRSRQMLGGREELLREQETRARLARRLDDITAGRVTM